MAYLDSAGNVDPTAQATTEQWQQWTRKQMALNAHKVVPAAPGNAVVAGSEKACKGTH